MMTESHLHPRQIVIGCALALTTMLIWSGWNLISRFGVTHDLTVGQITFLRFTMAGLIALPITWAHRKAIFSKPKWALLLMVVGAGAPYLIPATAGFIHAPASHGVLIPGTMLLCVAILSHIIFKEHFRYTRILGYLMIAGTIFYRVASHGSTDLLMLQSDAYFMLAGLMWAVYTVTMKHTGMSPIAATALVSAGSLVLYCVPYGIIEFHTIRTLSVGQSISQVLYQGIMASFVALICYNKATALIGVARTSAFAALMPAMVMVLAIPLLGEYPRGEDITFAVMLSVGVLLSTGILSLGIQKALNKLGEHKT